MASVNKVILIGNLGADPEIRKTQGGQSIANMRIATSESWRDKASGEKRERTEWHTVAVFQEGLVPIIERYLKKGSKVYLEGQLRTRKWQDKEGQDRYSTEVVLQGFDAKLVMLDGRNAGAETEVSTERPAPSERKAEPAKYKDDAIPFALGLIAAGLAFLPAVPGV